MIRRARGAAILVGLAALASAGVAARREARAWSPHPRSEQDEADRAVAALAASLPPGALTVGWRGPEGEVERFQLAQYALVPRVLVQGGAREYVLASGTDAEVAALAAAEGLTPLGRRGGFHLLRRAAP